MKRFFYLLLSLLITSSVTADEGMWTLHDLSQANRERMAGIGFTLSPEQLYDSVNPSLKDAVVHFAGGCTGVTVSEKGLLFTNHHCGYGAIQSQSSIENDYLRDGFIARNMEEELPIPGMYVRYLLKTVDVTDEILAGITDTTEEKERMKQISEKSAELKRIHSDKSRSIEATVNSYFSQNRFFLNIYEVKTDIRLVMAPPTSIGKFGADTDNWMWPRHTGDFCLFRVYTNPEGKEGHHKENVPYRPRYIAPVSVGGYKEGSFAMTIGYPGSTSRYLSSWGVEQRVRSTNEPRIMVRGIKQDIWREAMLAHDAVRIKYASKYAGSSNYWKNSIGMNRGIERMGVIERKREVEKRFRERVGSDAGFRNRYGETLNLLERAYSSTLELQRIFTLLNEAFLSGAEIIRIAQTTDRIASEPLEKREELIDMRLSGIYKNYEPALDEKVLAAMLQVVKEQVPAEYLPDLYREIDKKYKGDYTRYAADLFKKSATPDPGKLKRVLLNPKKGKELEKDPAVLLARSVANSLSEIRKKTETHLDERRKGERLFMAGLMEMDPDKNYPSDANSTMRMSYGSISGYEPADGAWYRYYTTQKGIFQKYKEGDHEFHVQPEILEMLRKKEFEPYGNSAGDINICFLSNNDITGGNSGSPVFDGNGRVIGLAFDGNWEAMSGDIAFETDVQRCINVDMRYILYVIDRWAGCKYILDELIIED